jgi:hypothetical protein
MSLYYINYIRNFGVQSPFVGGVLLLSPPLLGPQLATCMSHVFITTTYMVARASTSLHDLYCYQFIKYYDVSGE